ncbi:nuclear transport factor 2 family protein [Streptacidiphilus pinicola]|nr:nuclear transport factor 2 family protein [Streptacidiphilus pinicola]
MSSDLSTTDSFLDAWASAELAGDAAALEPLLHERFRAVGPFGFLLDREQWLKRFADGLAYSAFSFSADEEAREVGGVTFVIGTQQQQGTYQGHRTDGAFRVSLALTGGPQWRLVGIHLSLRTPPTSPERQP